MMTQNEMEQLARKLAAMRFNRAKGHIRGMDKHGRIELFRVAVGSEEWLTRFALPTKNLLITLVEQKEAYGPPSDEGYRRTRFKYVEARVEPLPLNHLKDNEGNNAYVANQNMEPITPPR